MSTRDTRLAILKAALESFSDTGYLGSPTRAIAKAAGVSEMTLFRHFETKQQLFEAVFATFIFQPSMAKLGAELSGDLHQVLATFARRFLGSLKKNKPIITIMLQELPRLREQGDPLDAYRVKLKDLLVEQLEQLRREGGFRGEAETVAITYLSSLFGIFLSVGILSAFAGEADLDTAGAELARCFALANA